MLSILYAAANKLGHSFLPFYSYLQQRLVSLSFQAAAALALSLLGLRWNCAMREDTVKGRVEKAE
jgi:hypothetical protein